MLYMGYGVGAPFTKPRKKTTQNVVHCLLAAISKGDEAMAKLKTDRMLLSCPHEESSVIDSW